MKPIKSISKLKATIWTIAFWSFSSVTMAAMYDFKDLQPEGDTILDQIAPETIELDQPGATFDFFEQPDASKTKDEFNALFKLIGQKKWKEAQDNLSALIQQFPDQPELYNLQAVIYSAKNKKAEANQSYEKALSLDQNNINGRLGLARLNMEVLKLDKAKELLDQALSIDDKVTKVYLLLADIAYHDKKLKDVETILLKGFEKVQGNIKGEIELYNALEKFYRLQKQPEPILALGQEIVKRHPDNTAALSVLVRAQFANDQKQAAEQTLRQIISLDNQVISHRLLLAKLLTEQQKQEEEVLKLLNEAIEKAPNQSQALMMKSAYLIQLRQVEEALKTINILEKKFPQLVEVKLLKGDAYLAEKKLNEALEAYKKAYQVAPNDQLLFAIVDLMSLQNKPVEAIALLKEELKKNDRNVAIHFRIAGLFEQQNDDKNAETHYQAILKLQPDHPIALNNLAWLYSQNDNPKALELAKSAYTKAPEVAPIVHTYGTILLRRGNAKEGLDILTKAVILAPTVNDYQFHLAEAYVANNEREKAVEILQTIVKAEQDFIEKQAAVNLLEKLR